MSWYPGATKMELQPESDKQEAIRPTQMVVHSIVAPWTPRRTYEYWRDSTNLESHFGVGYAGDIAQYIGTETRADANYQANRRADGTGAVSVETASNTSASDPWTRDQIEELIRLGVWMHTHHGLPLRVCRTHNDPGYGYHSLHPQWSTSGTACPGSARIRQFHQVVFPQIVARATGTTSEEDPMALTDDDVQRVADAVVTKLLARGGALENSDLDRIFNRDIIPAARPPYNNADYETNKTWTFKYAVQTNVEYSRRAVALLNEIKVALAEGGGLTTAEVQAAAEAGAQAALNKLADALSNPAPTRKDSQS